MSQRGFVNFPLIIAGLVLTVGTMAGGVILSQLQHSQDTRSQAATSCSGMTESTCKATNGCNWTPGSASTQTHSCSPIHCDEGEPGCSWTSTCVKQVASYTGNCGLLLTKIKCDNNSNCKWSNTCNGTYTTSTTTPGSCSGTVATPSPKPNYQSCSANSDCQSNNCQAASGGKFCFPAGVDPSAPVPAGGTCGTTAYDRVCVTGYTCQSNKCQLSPTSSTPPTSSPKPNYQSCSANSDCQSNNCQAASGGKFCFPAGVDPSAPVPAGGTCGTTAYDRECVSGYTCQSNKCQPPPTPRPNNASCNENADCQSNNCQPASGGKFCLPAGSQTVSLVPAGGTCGTTAYDRQCVDNYTCRTNKCLLVDYQSCSSAAQCASNNCQAASGGRFCFPAGVDPSAPVPAGGTCGTTAYDRVCVTGYTCQSNKCVPSPASTPTPPPPPKPDYQSCSANSDCQSSNCQAVPGGKFCFPAGVDPIAPVPAGGACGTTAYDRVCEQGYSCSNGTCVLTSSLKHIIPYGQACAKDDECMSGICQKDPTDNTLRCKQVTYCSTDNSSSITVNHDLGVQQIDICLQGCQNGKCINDSILDYEYCNEANEGQLNYLKTDICTNGEWRCVEDFLKPPLTYPGQSNQWSYALCKEGQWVDDYDFTQNAYSQFYCQDNNIYSYSSYTNQSKFMSACPNGTMCVDSTKLPDEIIRCMPQQEYDSRFCEEGDTRPPSQEYECLMTCADNHTWVYTDPLQCQRPNLQEQNLLCYNGNLVTSEKTPIEFCEFGCWYGKCMPNPERECPIDDYYIDGFPPCLAKCDPSTGEYQRTNLCAGDLRTTGDWSPQEKALLLNSVYAYPDDLVINLEVEFLRVDNAYAFCFNNCQWLSSGYYSPNNNTIGIPDSGLLESTFHHEITHAIDFNNPGLINEFIDKTGCHQNPADPNGNYLYTEYPYRDYGKYNCNEGLAVSCGEEYMDPDMSCYMKFVRPIQYNFCRDNIFSGKEFCVPPRG